MRLRSHRIHLSNEARVLKELRVNRSLSMRQAGELFGKSDSYISQIEHGRIRPPEGPALNRLLEIYCCTSVESYYVRVRNFKERLTKKEEIIELIQKINDEESKIILKIVQALVA